MNIALITGANRGLGFEIAQTLGQRGMYIILGARDADKGRAAIDALSEQNVKGECVQIDVSDGASIHAAAAEVTARHPHLDVLVNNAGLLNDYG
ncbi:MAG TPA: dehydrogenase, partial [Gammaproteobacteria bacterium]|nr:dehydrogenase [Gammaproteobacteria bacterium]